MYDISINPLMQRNIIDGLVECISLSSSMDKWGIALSSALPYDLVTLDWSEYRLVDFLGHSINLVARLDAFLQLVVSLSESKLQDELNSCENKYLVNLEELKAAIYDDCEEGFNIVDFCYTLMSLNKEEQDKAIKSNLSNLLRIAYGGYDLIYFFGDVSKLDFKNESDLIVENRKLCFDVLDRALKMNKE